MEFLMWAAKNPVPAMLLGSLLYLWIAVGFYFMKEYWMAGMWLCYAIANVCLAGYTKFRILK